MDFYWVLTPPHRNTLQLLTLSKPNRDSRTDPPPFPTIEITIQITPVFTQKVIVCIVY